MKTLIELQEERANLWAKAEAILAVADEEKRELTDDEKAAYDKITAEETGDIALLDVDIERAKRRERQEAKIAGEIAATMRTPLEAISDTPPKITVPASAHQGRLKAFESKEDAYSAGQWFLANFVGNEPAANWCKEHGLSIRNVLTGAGNYGIVVPDVLENTIINLREDRGVFRREAQRWPMSSDTTIVPRRSAGLTTYFVGEETATTASDTKHDAVKLIARTLSTLTRFSTEIAADAVIAIAEMLAEEAALALATTEDKCGFLGDGTSTYGSIVGLIGGVAAGSTVTATAGNTAFSTLDLLDFESMIGKLPEYPGIQPKWFISKAGWAASMLRLQNAAGGNTTMTLAAGVPPLFAGYPVIFCQEMNSTLTAQTSTDGICYFGDLRMAALFGDRRGVEMMQSEHRYMEYRQIGLIVSERFDINVHGIGTASVAGPIIMLATPSA